MYVYRTPFIDDSSLCFTGVVFLLVHAMCVIWVGLVSLVVDPVPS